MPHIPRDGDSALAVGAQGYGKTTVLGAGAARDVVRDQRKLVALDPYGDVEDNLIRNGVSKHVIKRAGNAAEAWDLFRGHWYESGAQVVTFRWHKGTDPEKTGMEWLRVVDDERARGFVCFCDEAELTFPNAGLPRGIHLRTIKSIRNRKQRWYMSAHRPQALAALLRSNMTRVLVFRADSRPFVKIGCAEFGDSERFDRAHTLKRFEYLYRDRDTDDFTSDLPVLDARNGPPWP